ncbi:MAG: serine/threonine-protein kinase [Thermoanaerobaculia bacterium]
MDPRPDPGVERWRRLEALLDRWIDADDERKRDAILETVREDDPSLLRELETMLGHLSTRADLLDRPLVEGADALLRELAVEDEAAREAGRRGRVLGPYRLLDLIDRGGMGVVYLAERADEQFEKQVAVKLLPAGLRSREAERRFLNERQILAHLEHPNIARLLDGGVTEEGTPYLVMELVDGQPIDVFCDERHLDPASRLKLVLQVCAAVQHAHRHLVIHRDLKPGNILVDSSGRVKLLDFGIAKLQDPELAGAGGATVFQPRSVRYASPEQIANRPVSAASDVYSLGVILFELLAGHPPYELAGLSPTELERVVCEKPPEPPSQRATTWKRRLAGDLDNIVLKALRKDPEERYGSAAELADDLQRYLEGLPVRARPGTRRYRAAKFIGRHRFAVAAAAVLLLLALAGAVAIVHQARVAARERDRAERTADFVLEFMTIPDPDRGGGTTVTSRELLDQARTRTLRELADQPDMQTRILEVIADGYQNLGVYGPAIELREELVDRYATVGDVSRLGRTQRALGAALADAGRGEEAVDRLEEALELQRNELGPRSSEVAETLGALARAIAVGLPPGDPRAGRIEPLLREAIDIHRRAGDRDDPDLAADLHLLGQTCFAQAFSDPERRELHVREAVSTMDEALAMRRRIYGDRAFPVAETLNDLGLGLDSVGRSAEAMPMLEEALEIHREVLGEEHPDTLHILGNVAAMHRDAGDYEEAERLYREALGQWKKIHPNGARPMAAVIYGFANVLFHQGRLDEAEAQLRWLGEVLDDDPDEPRYQVGESLLGEIEMSRGRFAEAELRLLSSYSALQRLFSEAHPATVEARERLVSLYESWGRPEDAERFRRGEGSS